MWHASLIHEKARETENTIDYILPKMANNHNKKFVQRWLFSIKNLQFGLKGPAFDSDRCHLGGLDVRADQNDQKVDFEYPPPNLSVSILGALKAQELSNRWNFPNRLISRKLNSRGIVRIKCLLTRGHSWVLGAPRSLYSFFAV